MKVLHYLPGLPPVRGGGLVKYALDLAHGEAELGNEVSILVPGRFTFFNRDKSKIIAKKWEDLSCYQIINPLPVSAGRGFRKPALFAQPGDRKGHLQFLRFLEPDVIHMHSLMGLHAAFLFAAKELGIPVIYTSHDYYGLCPVAILLKGKEECQERNWNSCIDCMTVPVSDFQLYLEQSMFYRYFKNNNLVQCLEHKPLFVPLKQFVRKAAKRCCYMKTSEHQKADVAVLTEDYEKLRYYYRKMFLCIDLFHFNSRQSQKIFEKYLGKVNGTVIPISNANITDRRMRRNYTGTLNIAYIGTNSYHKGFPILKEALDELYLEGFHNFVCHIYFNPREKMLPYIKNHAPYRAEQMENVYRNMDVLILPSVCRETFGMVIPEALSYGIPVVISDHVGAKDILQEHDGMGMVVKPCKNDLKQVVKSIYEDCSILSDMNQKICSWKTDLSFEKHIQEILKMKEGVVKR